MSDVMITGGLSSHYSATVVNLVSLARVRVRGLMNRTQALPVRLSLHYLGDGFQGPSELWFCPEPSGLTLLGAAGGIALAGRSLRRRAQR